MFPKADIPVVALSVDSLRSPKEQYNIGRMLAPLRDEGILLIGSGGLVHNLRMLNESDQPEEWALEFDAWIAKGLESWDLPSLFAYEKKLRMFEMRFHLTEESISHLSFMRWEQRMAAGRQSEYFKRINMGH